MDSIQRCRWIFPMSHVKNLDFFHNVEMAGIWPTYANTAIFFLIPRSVTGDRSTASLPTLILWLECLGAPGVMVWMRHTRLLGMQAPSLLVVRKERDASHCS